MRQLVTVMDNKSSRPPKIQDRWKVLKNLGGPVVNMAKNQLKKMVQSCQKMAKNCRKRPKIVENGQNQRGIKLILPGKTEPEVHQLTPSELAPLNPPVSAGPEH